MTKKLIALLATLTLALPQPATALQTADIVEETIFTIMETQPSPTWGLDRIDGTLDGAYTYSSSGSGVRVYVVDTGVDSDHPDFQGRVVDGYDAFDQNLDQEDCNGHGTHVAGIVAGATYGVAKAATVVPVRVMNCAGQGTTSTLLAGIDWILKTHPAGTPAVVNMSIGGAKDEVINAATGELISAGMSVVVAAGNFNLDACTLSPASAEGVVTVGSISAGDIKSPFSNWGQCIDVFAPGSKILSNNSANYASASQKSGTSQSAAFVSGAIALYISAGLAVKPSEVDIKLRELSEKNVVSGSMSSVSDLISVRFDLPTPVQAPTPTPTPTPTPEVQPEAGSVKVTQKKAGSSIGTLTWDLVEGASSYTIYKTGSIRPAWSIYSYQKSTTSKKTIVDKPGSIAIYRVVAIVSGKEVQVGKYRYYPSR